MTHPDHENASASAVGAQAPRPVGPKAAVKSFFKNYAQFKGYSTRGEFWWPWLTLALVHLAIVVIAGVIAGMAFPDDIVSEAYNPPGQPEVSYYVWFDGMAGVIMGFASLLSFVVFALTISPLLAVNWRRLHDAGLPGPLFFLWFIPFIGWIIVLILLALPSKPHTRRPEWDAFTASRG